MTININEKMVKEKTDKKIFMHCQKLIKKKKRKKERERELKKMEKQKRDKKKIYIYILTL